MAKTKPDWKYWIILICFLVTIIVILIQKINVTMVEKPNKCNCDCNCIFEEREQINWSGFNSNIWNDWNITNYNLSCKTCWDYVK